MGEYFKPWRRKIGVITLMMACVFMGGWVRSLEFIDVFNCPIGKSNSMAVASSDGAITWRVGWNKVNPWQEVALFTWPTTTYKTWLSTRLRCDLASTTDYRYRFPFPTGEGDSVVWFLKWSGFGIGGTPPKEWDFCQQKYLIVRYWSMTVSLNLISLCLLFSRPRKSNPKKITEPITTEGT
jgi:hypothetical protein